MKRGSLKGGTSLLTLTEGVIPAPPQPPYLGVWAYSVSDFEKWVTLFHYISLLCYLELQSSTCHNVLKWCITTTQPEKTHWSVIRTLYTNKTCHMCYHSWLPQYFTKYIICTTILWKIQAMRMVVNISMSKNRDHLIRSSHWKSYERGMQVCKYKCLYCSYLDDLVIWWLSMAS